MNTQEQASDYATQDFVTVDRHLPVSSRDLFVILNALKNERPKLAKCAKIENQVGLSRPNQFEELIGYQDRFAERIKKIMKPEELEKWEKANGSNRKRR